MVLHAYEIHTLPMNTNPLRVEYGGTYFKSRTRNMIKEFIHRFYTPFAFILWTVVAFNLHTCINTPAICLAISIVAALFNAHSTYCQWIQNILLLTESKEPKISTQIKISIAVSDFIVHFICTLLSFWWIDDLHECIPLARSHMGAVWIFLVVFAFSLHAIQYRAKNKRIEHIIRTAYKHIEPSDP